MKNYYNILGVDRTSSAKTIKKRTYVLGKKAHPKKAKYDVLDAKEFIEIIEAYFILSNDETRQVHDWILDHESGKSPLRELALIAHQKTMKSASQFGVKSGKDYTKEPFWIFRDDMKSTFWWNFFSSLPTP
jgi:DnaJ-class molecular chaperone